MDFQIFNNTINSTEILNLATIFFSAGIGALIKHFWPKVETKEQIEKLSVEERIRDIAKKEFVDPDLAVKVARCESGLNPEAINRNKGDSYDRGIFQINTKYHPEVTDDEAFDVEFSTRFFCKEFKNGNLSWWNASKSCWNK